MNLLFAMAACLYSLSGHGGASSYAPLAMASGLSPLDARSVALLLNLLVAGMAAGAFAFSGHLRLRLAVPLLLGAMPFACLGSRLLVSSPYVGYGLAVALLWGAWRLAFGRELREAPLADAPGAWPLALIGAALGLLAGLTGVGGGIYLSPLLLFKRWVTLREAAALSACFIWANSAVSLLATGVQALPRPEWVAACLVGGLLGAVLGARLIPTVVLRRALGSVLLLAALQVLVR